MNKVTQSPLCCCIPRKEKDKKMQYETFISTRRSDKELNDIFFSAIKQTKPMDISRNTYGR